LDVFREKKAKDLVKEDKKGLMKLDKEKALSLQKQLQDISYEHLKHFYTNVPDEQKEFELLMMENQISDQFFIKTGFEQEELDIVFSSLNLLEDQDYLDI